jgi:hypothetical protein
MTDFHQTERIARQLCEEAGRDYDAKGCKRLHWRRKAARVVAVLDGKPTALARLMRAIGWRV